jgi:hypothetical protein
MLFTWCVSNVADKIDEAAHPPRTHCYPARSIVFEPRIVFVVAPLLHINPSFVFLGVYLAVLVPPMLRAGSAAR